MTEYLLELSGYGVSFGRNTILRDINLRFPARGMVILLGPCGTGKSTLLRTLAGVNDASPSLQTEGSARFMNAPLGTLGTPAIVMQKTRLMMATLRENIVNELPERHSLQLYQQRDIATRLLINAGLSHLSDDLERCVIDLSLGEQRLVALVRTLAANPKMIMVDEPTSGISDKEAAQILCLLNQEAEKRAVITVLHHQRQARLLGGTSVLLAGGTVVENRPTTDFFANPQTSLGKDFVRTGSCCAPVADTGNDGYLLSQHTDHEDHLPREDTNTAMPQRVIKSHAFGPRNFLWLKKGQLAGTPRPGLTLSLDLDLAALQRVGISVLVSLESEADPIGDNDLQRYGIRGLSLPIKDMGTPSLEEARSLCETMSALIAQGEAIALHCKAGIGRTGTMLVTYLIMDGMSALDALEFARRIEPRWVQSSEQVEFLERFESFMTRSAEEKESAPIPIPVWEGNNHDKRRIHHEP